MKRYLLQLTWPDENIGIRTSFELKTEREIIEFVNAWDIYSLFINDYRIYDMGEFGKVTELHYRGWKPNCLIELEDNSGNVVISGYGEDH